MVMPEFRWQVGLLAVPLCGTSPALGTVNPTLPGENQTKSN
jgi:hypothetical protein